MSSVIHLLKRKDSSLKIKEVKVSLFYLNLQTRQESKVNNEKLDYSDLKGQPILKRSMEICAAGMHNILLFGPSCSGKTMAAKRLPGILSDLKSGESPEINKISLIKAGHDREYSEDLQLIMIVNPCPCGNLGKENSVCICSINEIYRYWKKIGVFLLDRIDMRVPVKPVDPAYLLTGESETSESIKKRVVRAAVMQERRYKNETYVRNGRIPVTAIKKYCSLDEETRALFSETVSKLSLSPGACHSILKIARTIADLNECENIEQYHFLEAVYYRRYGDRDIFWNEM